MSPASLASLVERLAGHAVLCVGDVMLDRFVYGSVERVSPEAPIPVLHEMREARMLGGAGNVVRNLAALGVEARIAAIVGDDAEGAEIANLLAAEPGLASGLVTVPGRASTLKTRYVAGAQQLLRADRESREALPAEAAQRLLKEVGALLPGVGAIILSDYGKGVLAPATARALIAAARDAGVPVIVDPKGSDFNSYGGADVVTPNRAELAAASGLATESDAEIEAAARAVMKTSGIDGVLATRSAAGMTLVSGAGVVHVAADAREVFDVSGAGDTVVAVLAAALAAGAEAEDAVRLANTAAGVVVGKLGTAVAFPGEIIAALHRQAVMPAAGKLVGREEAARRVSEWRAQGLKVGFTNGCFDLLHPGHVHLLSSAAHHCDRLVVGLNDDASVRRLKGAERPVQQEDARALVLGALEPVDLVVLFGEDTPMALIELLRPDVLFKGADYARADVVGGDFVESTGGEVRLIELAPGHSTSATIARMAR